MGNIWIQQHNYTCFNFANALKMYKISKIRSLVINNWYVICSVKKLENHTFYPLCRKILNATCNSPIQLQLKLHQSHYDCG